MAAYRALGAEPGALDPQADEYFYRGHVFEELEVRRLQAKYGRENVIRQVEIDWGFGEPGHADGFVIPEQALVEIKSTSTPTFSTPMVDMAIAQSRLYLRFYPDADCVWLLLLDPNRMKPADLIVVRNTPEDVAEIDAALAQLRQALEAGPLPERVCVKPGQARGRFCSFAATCFEGWEPEAPASISDPYAVSLAVDLARVRGEIAALKRQLEPLEDEEKATKAELAQHVEEGESLLGPWVVTLNHVQRSPTFSSKLARAAGFPLETLDEFMRPGADYDTIRIRPAEAAGDVDYGDEAPF